MAYTELGESKTPYYTRVKDEDLNLMTAALRFIHDSCEGLRFDRDKKSENQADPSTCTGRSNGSNKIPYNMQMDIDRLCLEKSLRHFIESGSSQDAFDIYVCFCEMFLGTYKNTRRMTELLSEFESNSSSLLMKHRDHYSHSAYVFALGLSIYETMPAYRKAYKDFYQDAFQNKSDDHEAAGHFLHYWGLTSLFHDIGYPFELPFEQVESYFEVNKEKRDGRPFMAYNRLKSFITISESKKRELSELYQKNYSNLKKKYPTMDEDFVFETTNDLFAFDLANKLGDTYKFTRQSMRRILEDKPVHPDHFGNFMDHGWFSATILFQKMFEQMNLPIDHTEIIDAMTAIILHNSLYKFCIAYYKNASINIPLKAELHPLAYLLMLCDELQVWNRKSYGRNTRTELHPMDCAFSYDVLNNTIKAKYIFDKSEMNKVKDFENQYYTWKKNEPKKENDKTGDSMPDFKNWENTCRTEEERVEKFEGFKKKVLSCSVQNGNSDSYDYKYKQWEKQRPKMKAFSSFYMDGDEESEIQKDIESIVCLTDKGNEQEVKELWPSHVHISISFAYENRDNTRKKVYLSEGKFINIYNFAVALNGRYSRPDEWKVWKQYNSEQEFLNAYRNRFEEDFEKLSLEYKLSNIGQAKAFARYLDNLGYFYTDRDVDFEEVTEFTEDDVKKIGPLEHFRWLKEHYEMGWSYCDDKNYDRMNRDIERQHKDMAKPEFLKKGTAPKDDSDALQLKDDLYIDEDAARKNYNRLDPAEQEKDYLQLNCMLALLKMYDGLRIYKYTNSKE